MNFLTPKTESWSAHRTTLYPLVSFQPDASNSNEAIKRMKYQKWSAGSQEWRAYIRKRFQAWVLEIHWRRPRTESFSSKLRVWWLNFGPVFSPWLRQWICINFHFAIIMKNLPRQLAVRSNRQNFPLPNANCSLRWSLQEISLPRSQGQSRPCSIFYKYSALKRTTKENCERKEGWGIVEVFWSRGLSERPPNCLLDDLSNLDHQPFSVALWLKMRSLKTPLCRACMHFDDWLKSRTSHYSPWTFDPPETWEVRCKFRILERKARRWAKGGC